MVTLTELERRIRKELIGIAKVKDGEGSLIEYKILADKFEVPYPNDNQYIRNLFHDMLGNISRYEHNKGRPLLSVVVVKKGSYFPGDGFYTLAKDELKKQKPWEDNDSFAINERKALFERWKNLDDPDK
jgi:hypothetical protein